MLDELRTFIVLTETGSLQRAAKRLCQTPSAVTRRIQRLELALGAEMLDRRVKPPRITPIGQSVLEHGRDLMRTFELLKASASNRAQPVGAFKLGLGHGLAVPGITAPLRQMTNLFPSLRPQLSADMTASLLERVRRGELDAAVMLLPSGDQHPADLVGTVIATDKMSVIGPPALLNASDKSLPDLKGKSWVLNPPGCFVRESLRTRLEAAGLPLNVAAEVYNIDMQVSLVSAGYGLGLVPNRFLQERGDLKALRAGPYFGFHLPVSITFVKAGNLGRLEPAARSLQDELAAYFRG